MSSRGASVLVRRWLVVDQSIDRRPSGSRPFFGGAFDMRLSSKRRGRYLRLVNNGWLDLVCGLTTLLLLPILLTPKLLIPCAILDSIDLTIQLSKPLLILSDGADCRLSE